MENQNSKTKEIYCDWASTALFDTEILEKAYKTSIEFAGNPSSVHQKGIDAKNILQNARKRSAKVLGIKEENIIFTSGGTESNHLPILSLLNRPNKGSILFSSLEHPAIREQAEIMKKCGFQVFTIPSDENGIITAENVVKSLKDDTVLVCVMAVNNETGSIMPIYEISDAITLAYQGKRRPKFHVDAVQAAGKIPLDLSYKGIDFASISAHKIGGPRGIGILYTKDKFEPFLRGGGQENGLRSGTENLFGAEAISLCLEKYFIKKGEVETASYKRYLEQIEYTGEFTSKLKENPSCIFIPENRQAKDERFSPWVLQVAFKNLPGEVLVRELSSRDIYISTGSACSSKKLSRPILEAMKISKDIAQWGVRFSFGHSTTKEEMMKVVDELEGILKKFG